MYLWNIVEVAMEGVARRGVTSARNHLCRMTRMSAIIVISSGDTVVQCMQIAILIIKICSPVVLYNLSDYDALCN